jgi:NAD-dependent dihydropyrimidine dehydrogenase PreA subunit
MQRNIIKIDRDLCDGCGLCVDACAEGAIQLIDDKATLVSEVYCDGLGACIGDCPTGALTIEKREAVAFDEEATEEYLARIKAKEQPAPPASKPLGHFGGCPGSALRNFDKPAAATADPVPAGSVQSQLGHWPVQLMLVPPHAPFLQGADILICADCVPFALPDFHSRFLSGRAVLIGCPKLDDNQYYLEKLKETFAVANPKSITVLKMEVPCCSGIAHAAIEAQKASAPDVPLTVRTIGIRGDVYDEVEQA